MEGEWCGWVDHLRGREVDGCQAVGQFYVRKAHFA